MTLIADNRSGLYDDHCKPRKIAALDDLFGITRLTKVPALGISMQDLPGSVAKADPSIAAKGATVFNQVGGIPLFLSKKLGKGTTFLLNCDMNSFVRLFAASKPYAPDTASIRTIFSRMVPHITLEDRRGTPLGDIQVARWRDRDTEIIALFRETGSMVDITVSLSEPKYIYDLRSRKSLGLKERYTTMIIPSHASFFVASKNPDAIQNINQPLAPH